MSTYFAILTAVGEAKIANANALGAVVQITQMAVGDGNGAATIPSRSQTALVREQRRAPLNSLSIDPLNASQIIAEQVIPESIGGWWIREIGLIDADGDLVAVANCPPTYKPVLAEGSGRTQVIRMVLIVSSTGAVQLKIDPGVVLATRAYADQLIVTHAQVAATEAASGHVMLASSADAISGNGGTKAVTPAGVKGATDKVRTDLSSKSPSIFIVDQLRHAVESASGGRMTVLYTTKKQPCYMHVLPRFLLEDVAPGGELGSGTHPAFLVNGVAKSELFIGAYLASMSDGEALALPGMPPQVSYTFDQARAACVANGAGWHLMTNWEWAAVALWCMANGFQPRGNTDWGRHHTSRFETGRRVDGGVPGGATGNGATLTGSGPAAWSHDGTPAGIADLVGNVWEWNDGMRLQDGRVYMPNDNNYTLAEASWPAQNLWFSGSSTTANGTVNLITTSAVTRNGTVGDDNNSGLSDYRNPWSSTPITGTAPLATKQALIAPAGISPLGAVYARTYGVRFPLRGAVWSYAGSAGLATLDLTVSRGYVFNYFGFRPAFAL